jgi:nicotinamidase-related amidase
VIISGISTDVCCDSTTREANARDFRVLFLSDATAVAGPDPEPTQRSTLETMEALFAQVVTVEDALRKIKEGLGR